MQKKRKTGIMMGVALLLGVIVVNGIIKNVCGRIRPYDFDATIKSVETLLISKPSDYSFPSGHTLACFECATVLMWKDKKFGIPALIIALLVSFSRLYLCVHYPTDVIFGAIFGIINGILGIVIVNAVYKLINKRFNKNFQ